MRAVVQRVSSSKVIVDNNVVGSIERGLNVLLGISKDDTLEDLLYIRDKVINLRVFQDDNDKMNLSLLDVGGEILVISQFTLYGDCRKGKRPSFSNAARPDLATTLYEEFIEKAKSQELVVGTGEFGAHMMVDLTNDGPVTILLESNKSF